MDVPEPSPSITVSKVLYACDECRARKLKCSGESTGCTRCIADGIPCHYSPRKQMGRPRKRRREDAAHNQDQDSWGLGYANGGDMTPQEPEFNTQYSVNNAPYAAPNGDASLPVLDINLLELSMHNAPLYNQNYDENDQSAEMNFDLSQELSTNPLMNFPEPMPQNLSQPFAPDGNAAQLHTPSTTLNDHTGYAGTETQPAHCRCLPQLYTFLGAFQSPPNPSFPYSIAALKKAATFATEAVRCQECSKEYTSALQNSMLLGTLINLVINEYRKLLDHIDEQSREGEKKIMRMGDNSPSTQHLHTGTPDCPMGINLELSGDEWRVFARKTVRKEVYGPGDHNLTQILQEMKDRQQKWHSRYNGTLHQHAPMEGMEHVKGNGNKPCICIQGIFIDRLRQTLDNFGL